MAKIFKGAPAVFRAPIADIFVDEVTGFDLINGNLRIDLATIVRAEPIPPSDAVVNIIGRLILPTESAQRLCLGLYDYLKNHGLDPVAAAGADESQPRH